jgi:hypothetical protein
MSNERIYYKKGYKYQLTSDYSTVIDIKPEKDISTDYISLTTQGELTIKKGYASDGPSGPTWDTPAFMRGAFVHDAFYQLMRQKYLDKDKHRKLADKILQKMCIEDGMFIFWAWCVYVLLRIFGDPAADPANKKCVITAPR